MPVSATVEMWLLERKEPSRREKVLKAAKRPLTSLGCRDLLPRSFTHRLALGVSFPETQTGCAGKVPKNFAKGIGLRGQAIFTRNLEVKQQLKKTV